MVPVAEMKAIKQVVLIPWIVKTEINSSDATNTTINQNHLHHRPTNNNPTSGTRKSEYDAKISKIGKQNVFFIFIRL